MHLVDLSIVLFAIWMLVAEDRPWAILTLMVSLATIFYATRHDQSEPSR